MTVKDAANATATQNFSITINPNLSIAPAALIGADAGLATNQTITVSNGTKPYTSLNISAFSAGATGLTLGNLTVNTATGIVVLSGTPSGPGTYSFTANVTDTANTTFSKGYTLFVNAALSIAPANLNGATAGTQTNQTINVTNGTLPYTTLNVSAFNGGTTGLTVGALTTNANTGTVSLNGTPTAAGTVTFTVNVTDTAGGALSKPYTLTVNPPLSISPSVLAEATAGFTTNQTLTVSNGTLPYGTFNVTNFAAGGTGLTPGNIVANASTGTFVLSTPTNPGTATFTVNVNDSAFANLTQGIRSSSTRPSR